MLRFQPTAAEREVLSAGADSEMIWLAAEQSNSSLTIGDSVMLKIFRRIVPGEHPESEMSRYLTAQGFANTPPLLGDIVRIGKDGTPHTLGIAVGFIRNQGDAWSWMLDHLTTRARQRVSQPKRPRRQETDLADRLRRRCGCIGRRLGEMHAILARPTADSAFAPERPTVKDATAWTAKTEERLKKAFRSIEQ